MSLFANINKGLEEFRNTPDAVLVDVREPDEYREGHIPGAVHVPLSDIEKADLDKNVPVFLYCLRGVRSERAASALKKRGYRHVKSIGGIMKYKGAIEK